MAALGSGFARRPAARHRERALLVQLFLITIGITLLVLGGEIMVRGATGLANRFGVSPLVIGLTIVSFGTSAPELAVNIIAAWRGNAELSFGNIFGSNMANIGLVIAVTALVSPLKIRGVVISREMPMMMLATLVASALALDGFWSGGSGSGWLGRGDGVVLLLLFSVFAYYALRELVNPLPEDVEWMDETSAKAVQVEGPTAFMIAFIVVGLLGLSFGGAFTVNGAENLARGMGVSEAVIGLTLVAVGTSLPELAASLVACFRGQQDLAVGNAVGSNIFNLLIVLGATAMIRPVPVPAGGAGDLLLVIGLTALLWITSRGKEQRLTRAGASLLLVSYLAYIGSRAALQF